MKKGKKRKSLAPSTIHHMSDEQNDPLLTLVHEQGLVDDLQFEELAEEHRRSGTPGFKLLQDAGILETDAILQAISGSSDPLKAPPTSEPDKLARWCHTWEAFAKFGVGVDRCRVGKINTQKRFPFVFYHIDFCVFGLGPDKLQGNRIHRKTLFLDFGSGH